MTEIHESEPTETEEFPPGVSYAARLMGGPFDGRTSIVMKGFPPEEVLAFEMEFFMTGAVAVRDLAKGSDFLTGDAIYRKVAQSTLYDEPDKLPIKHVQPGAAYEFVRCPEPSPDYSQN